MSIYSLEMAERAIQNFSDAYFKEVVLPRGGPIHHLLACSKLEASEALVTLIDIDAENAGLVRNLQNKVRLHLQLIEWVKKTVIQGEEIYDRLGIDDQEKMKLAILERSGGDTTMVDD